MHTLYSTYSCAVSIISGKTPATMQHHLLKQDIKTTLIIKNSNETKYDL